MVCADCEYAFDCVSDFHCDGIRLHLYRSYRIGARLLDSVVEGQYAAEMEELREFAESLVALSVFGVNMRFLRECFKCA